MTIAEFSRQHIAALSDYGSNTAASTGTTLTSSGSANTKGVYAQLSAAISRDADYLIIGLDNRLSNGFGAVDIAVGAAASEQIIIADLIASATAFAGQQFTIPFSIPAGSRLAARWQSTATSDTIRASVIAGSGNLGFKSYRKSDTYGFTAASSLGTAVDPGGTVNTKGAYSQITAATNRDHFGLAFAVDGQGDTGLTTSSLLMDIAIGAAASEQIIIPNIMLTMASTGYIVPFASGTFPVQIPAGSRIAVRAQSTTNAANARAFGITLYGFS